MKIFVIRHGHTELNKTGKIASQSIDDHLSEEGARQAEKLSHLLSKGIDKIYTSDLSRTRETAEIINKTLNVEIKLESDLREINVGRLTGKTWQEIRQEYGETLLREYRSLTYDFHKFGGESVEDVKKRVLRCLKKIKESNKGNNILVVTHAGIIRLLQYLLENKQNEKIENASIYSFEI